MEPLLYPPYTLRDEIDGFEQMQRGTTSNE